MCPHDKGELRGGHSIQNLPGIGKSSVVIVLVGELKNVDKLGGGITVRWHTKTNQYKYFNRDNDGLLANEKRIKIFELFRSEAWVVEAERI